MMIAILCIIIAIAFLVWGIYLERHSPDAFSCLDPLAIGLVFLLTIVPIASISVLGNYTQYDANCYQVQATRSILIDELEKYDEMRAEDLTASFIYFELRERVIEFNTNVIYAKAHDNIWFNYFLSKPEYTTVETIPFEVG